MLASLPLTLIITGMHRSGTSLTASILQEAGVNIGDKLAPATPTNKKGHFEDVEFVDFHKQVLASQGFYDAGWTSYSRVLVPETYFPLAQKLIQKRSDKPLWGWKDPRTVLFLDFWKELLPNSFFIFVYRPPWETIDSLYRRNIKEVDEVFYQEPELALQTWYSYNHAILRFYQNYPCQSLLIPLEYLTQDPNLLIQLVNKKAGTELALPSTVDLIDQSLLNQEVSSSHRPTILQKYFPETITLYQQLEQASISSGTLSSQSLGILPIYKNWVLKDWSELRRLEFVLNNKEKELQECHEKSSNLERKLTALQNKIIAIEASKFWQLRNIWFFLKSLIFRKEYKDFSPTQNSTVKSKNYE